MQTEVLTFRNGAIVATVVTNGERHQSYEPGRVTRHPSLGRAISYLEARGYSIEVESFNGR